jgi:hypothetical protein
MQLLDLLQSSLYVLLHRDRTTSHNFVNWNLLHRVTTGLLKNALCFPFQTLAKLLALSALVVLIAKLTVLHITLRIFAGIVLHSCFLESLVSSSAVRVILLLICDKFCKLFSQARKGLLHTFLLLLDDLQSYLSCVTLLGDGLQISAEVVNLGCRLLKLREYLLLIGLAWRRLTTSKIGSQSISSWLQIGVGGAHRQKIRGNVLQTVLLRRVLDHGVQ